MAHMKRQYLGTWTSGLVEPPRTKNFLSLTLLDRKSGIQPRPRDAVMIPHQTSGGLGFRASWAPRLWCSTCIFLFLRNIYTYPKPILKVLLPKTQVPNYWAPLDSQGKLHSKHLGSAPSS